MKIVVSHKPIAVVGGVEINLARAVNSPSTRTKYLSDNETEDYIATQIAQGFTCHVFEYVNSSKPVHSIETFSVAA